MAGTGLKVQAIVYSYKKDANHIRELLFIVLIEINKQCQLLNTNTLPSRVLGLAAALLMFRPSARAWPRGCLAFMLSVRACNGILHASW